MIKMKKEEAIEIIERNKDKSLSEIKRILKEEMPKSQREVFTNEDFLNLITQWDNAKKMNTQRIRQKNIKKIEGEER